MKASEYVRLGWNVMLVGRDKRPLFDWKHLQTQRVSPEMLAEWARKHRTANIAVITGAISGIVVLDVDGPVGQETIRGKPFPPTPIALTGREGGMHAYFKHPGFPVSNFARRLPGLDLRGDGGYVLAPPSVHPSGRRYRWRDGLSPLEIEPAPMPEWLLEAVERRKKPLSPQEWVKRLQSDARPGERHPNLVSIAGLLMAPAPVPPEVVLEILRLYNHARCKPPKPEEELVEIVAWVAGKQSGRTSPQDERERRIREIMHRLRCTRTQAESLLESEEGRHAV